MTLNNSSALTLVTGKLALDMTPACCCMMNSTLWEIMSSFQLPFSPMWREAHRHPKGIQNNPSITLSEMMVSFISNTRCCTGGKRLGLLNSSFIMAMNCLCWTPAIVLFINQFRKNPGWFRAHGQNSNQNTTTQPNCVHLQEPEANGIICCVFSLFVFHKARMNQIKLYLSHHRIQQV